MMLKSQEDEKGNFSWKVWNMRGGHVAGGSGRRNGEMMLESLERERGKCCWLTWKMKGEMLLESLEDESGKCCGRV